MVQRWRPFNAIERRIESLDAFSRWCRPQARFVFAFDRVQLPVWPSIRFQWPPLRGLCSCWGSGEEGIRNGERCSPKLVLAKLGLATVGVGQKKKTYPSAQQMTRPSRIWPWDCPYWPKMDWPTLDWPKLALTEPAPPKQNDHSDKKRTRNVYIRKTDLEKFGYTQPAKFTALTADVWTRTHHKMQEAT